MLVAEEQILAEYEARNQFDDEALCASVSRLTTDELICPVCTKLVQSQMKYYCFWIRSLCWGRVFNAKSDSSSMCSFILHVHNRSL